MDPDTENGGKEDDGIEADAEVTLADFLKSNYYLFNILSVFGAIALFLTTVGENEPPSSDLAIVLNVGVIGSLLLFIGVCYIINIKHARFMGMHLSSEQFSPLSIIIYGAFLVLFDLVAISIIVYVSRFGYSRLLVGTTVGAILVSYVTFYILSIIHTIVERFYSHWLLPMLIYVIAGAMIILITDVSVSIGDLSDPSEMIPKILLAGVAYGMMIFYVRRQ